MPPWAAASRASTCWAGQRTFWVEGVPVATVADYAEKLLPGRGGIGRYPKDAKHPARKTGWVHIDTRAGKSRWTM